MRQKTETFTRKLRTEVGLPDEDCDTPQTQLVSAELTLPEFRSLEALRSCAAMSRSKIIRVAVRRLLSEAERAGVIPGVIPGDPAGGDHDTTA